MQPIATKALNLVYKFTEVTDLQLSRTKEPSVI